eukprot:CAMPEP_0113846708 /NCGR_PEP_ID=MMETSP0372-20130328/1459_1 /TAXON_ID=340204 /ORGANISM="Lankesteria abbotti" /LENGTH=198 /DNA_ID=CAMNT_0000815885 /DNA_START=58 /DNA_END=654 /DNA_ORIENTATION=- /assembly_acc=CAM_ASM_000359
MSLKLQKRLAASVLGCGKRRIWMDPNERVEVAGANSRLGVRKLVKDGLVIRKSTRDVSRFRVRVRDEAKRKGRHLGLGKRQGTKNARMPQKLLWMRRLRVLRRLLRKYRDTRKIDKHLYHNFYVRAKGNQFKNKRVLIEAIHTAKNEALKQKGIREQLDARRARNNLMKEKKKAKEIAKAQKRLLDSQQGVSATATTG